MFSAKINDKNWMFKKIGHFLTDFGRKITDFLYFLRITALTHPRRHLREDCRKFQQKIMTKIEVISRKSSKNRIFVKTGNFFGSFWEKDSQF